MMARSMSADILASLISGSFGPAQLALSGLAPRGRPEVNAPAQSSYLRFTGNRKSVAADQLAREGGRALEGWGHSEHVLVLEQATAVGDPVRLRCLFWCGHCHVSQQVMQRGTSVQ